MGPLQIFDTLEIAKESFQHYLKALHKSLHLSLWPVAKPFEMFGQRDTVVAIKTQKIEQSEKIEPREHLNSLGFNMMQNTGAAGKM